MNILLLLAAVVAIIGGFAEGSNKIKDCRKNNSGVQPSESLFSFMFLDR